MQSCYNPFHRRRPSKLFSKTAGQKIVAANARKNNPAKSGSTASMPHGPGIGSRREPARGHHMAFFESHSFQ